MRRVVAVTPIILALLVLSAHALRHHQSISNDAAESDTAAAAAPPLQFGHDMKRHFMMRDGYTNLNHGAFGTVARVVYDAEQKWYHQMEQDCNGWFRGGYQPPLITARQRMSQFVSANDADLVIVENASSGLNSILRSLANSLPLKSGDMILRTTVAYPMVINVYGYLAEIYGANIVNVTIDSPITSDDNFLAPVQKALEQYGNQIKIATFDHIASYPAVILPIKELTALCHQYGIIVVVDGAHVTGNIPVNVTDIDADFYVSNGHKWLYSPKGSCMLWARPSLQYMVVPTVISSEYDTDFVDKYAYTGTRNYCPFLALTSALDFRTSVGGDAAIFKYIRELAWNSAQKMVKLWNTGLIVTNATMNSAIIDVITPTQNGTVVGMVSAALYKQYDTYIQTSAYYGQWYVRISAQIYLEESDFTTMATRFLELMKRFEATPSATVSDGLSESVAAADTEQLF